MSYQSRLIGELEEVNLRIECADEFIKGDVYKCLETIDKHLLLDQIDVMVAYRSILSKRIARAFDND